MIKAYTVRYMCGLYAYTQKYKNVKAFFEADLKLSLQKSQVEMGRPCVIIPYNKLGKQHLQ